jgi:putative redox protein
MKKQHQVDLEWKNDLSFNIGVDEHLIVLDGVDENKGLCPKPLMLASLAGCTAMDVATILKESRTRFKGFNIVVSGELSREKPQTYTKVHIGYYFTGEGLDEARIHDAVALSVNEQCGVLMMFKKFAEVTYEVKFNS